MNLKKKMTSQMAADLAESISGVPTIDGLFPSSDIYGRSRAAMSVQSPLNPLSDSAYTLASDQSMLSSDVDHWIHGYSGSNVEMSGVQRSRMPVGRRSMFTSTSWGASGLWYILALVLPLFSYNNDWRWQCTPSTVLHSAEVLFSHLSRFCAQIRAHVRRMAHDHIVREVFATAMDIVLVVYALGFLVLSLYQATVVQ